MKVVVTTAKTFDVNKQVILENLSDICDVEFVTVPFSKTKATESVLCDKAYAADALLLRGGYLTRVGFNRLNNLKVIATHGAGLDRVDVEAATAHGVIVCNTPGANANAVAELTFGLILCVARGIIYADRTLKLENNWGKGRYLGMELKGKTLTLIGFGNIGRRVAHIAKSFYMDICAYDPYQADIEIYKEGVTPMVLEDALIKGDIISVHVPLSNSTKGLIGEKEISLMKSSAYLINTSRSEVVKEDALIKLLKKKAIRGAAVDVLDQEPPKGRPLILGLPNVVVTPHIGGNTIECLAAIADIASKDIKKTLTGIRPKYVVNSEVLSNARIGTLKTLI